MFVSYMGEIEQLPAKAAVVRGARALEPCVWVVLGNVFADRVWTGLADGDAEVAFLDAAGVDAVVLGPEWLEFGAERLRGLVDRAGFYVLGANISDSLGGSVGHQFMLRKFPGAALGLCGVWLDSTDSRSRLAHVEYAAPDFAVRKALPLMRPRADLVGVVVRPGGEVPKWDADFLVGTGRDDMIAVAPPEGGMARLSLVVQGGRILDYSITEPDLAAAGTDSLTAAVLDSIRAVLDSVGSAPVARFGRAMSPAAATRELVKGVLRDGPDGFLSDGPLVLDTLGPGLLTVGALILELVSPGRLALVELSGQDLKVLLEDKSVSVEWRTALRNQRLVMHRQYSMAMTSDFFVRHPSLAGYRYELLAGPFCQAAVRILAKAGEGS